MSSSKLPRVWAISDPHWSASTPMATYHDAWIDHEARLEVEWRRRIHLHDLVLVPGDITFAKDPHPDLLRLHRLPGQKVLVPGNHDRWVQGQSRAKLNALLELYPSIHMLSHAMPVYETGPHLIVGYKGAEPPDSPLLASWPEEATGRRKRAAKHHRKAVEHARNATAEALHSRRSDHKVIAITHYPPSEEERAVMAPLGVDLWLHGHCHLSGVDAPMVEQWSQRTNPPQRCISSDYLHMIPLEVTGAVVRAPLDGYVDTVPRPAIA